MVGAVDGKPGEGLPGRPRVVAREIPDGTGRVHGRVAATRQHARGRSRAPNLDATIRGPADLRSDLVPADLGPRQRPAAPTSIGRGM